MDKIELIIGGNSSLDELAFLKNKYICEKIVELQVEDDQSEKVLQLLSNSLCNVSHIYLSNSIDCGERKWVALIASLGTALQELIVCGELDVQLFFCNIAGRCLRLTKITLLSCEDVDDVSPLQSIASSCPGLRVLHMRAGLEYASPALADADLAALAEQCSMLEELQVYSLDFTDQAVIVLAQHCPRLKHLGLRTASKQLTSAALLALSTHCPSLEELAIPWIPVPSPDLAARCAHALSRIRSLDTTFLDDACLPLASSHMTGLQTLLLDSQEDHLLVPAFLQHCTSLQTLSVCFNSSVTLEQLTALLAGNAGLQTLFLGSSMCLKRMLAAV